MPAPTLTDPTGVATGVTTATIGATTDTADGTIYGVVTTSSTPPSAAQVKSGLDHTGSFAEWAGSSAVGSTGAKTLNATGLSASTGYYGHLMHEDAAANQSNVVSSAQFTTNAASDTTAPTLVGSITIGEVTAASIAISWPAGSDNVGVTSYEVSNNGGSSWTDVGNTTSTVVGGLAPSTTYQLRVRAKDAAGNVSSPALSASQETDAPAPAQPSSLLQLAVLASGEVVAMIGSAPGRIALRANGEVMVLIGNESLLLRANGQVAAVL